MSSNISRRFLFPVLLLLFPLSLWASSNNSVTVDDYTVYFNAYNSSLLQPDVAKAYGLVRSKNRGVLSIVVRHKNGEHSKADVTATVRNLNNQMRKLNMHEAKDGEALYYISDFHFTDKEKLSFEVDVTPRGSKEPIQLNFQQQFFAD
jgi:hypothetical protein